MSNVLLFDQNRSKHPNASNDNQQLEQQQQQNFHQPGLMGQQEKQQSIEASLQQQIIGSHCDCSMRPACSGPEQRGLKRRAADEEENPILVSAEPAGDGALLTQLVSPAARGQVVARLDPPMHHNGPDESNMVRIKQEHETQQIEQIHQTQQQEGQRREDKEEESEAGEGDEEEDDAEEEEFNYEPVLSKILNEKKLTLANSPEVIEFLANLQQGRPSSSSISSSSATSIDSNKNNNM